MSDISEYDLMIERDTIFHSGACAKDQQKPKTLYQRPIGRVIIGTIRFDKETGEIVEDHRPEESPLTRP